jgi:hypothetical protein
LYDPSGYLIDVYSLEPGTQMKSVATPIHHEDLFLAILTDNDNLYSLKLNIVDVLENDDAKAA